MQPVYIRPVETTRKMLDEMDKARHADLWRVLVALSIRRLGPPTARTIASAFGTLDAIEHASVDELSQIDGIGPEIAESVVTWFTAAREPGNWRGAVLDAWKAAGVGVGQAQASRLPRFRQRGHRSARRQSRRIRQQENRLGRRRRECRLKSRKSRGTGHPHAQRRPIQTAARHRNS